MYIVGLQNTPIDFTNNYGLVDTTDETTALQTWVNYFLANDTQTYDSFLDSVWQIIFKRYMSTPNNPPVYNLDLIISLFPTYPLQFQQDLFNTLNYQLQIASGAITGNIYTYLNSQSLVYKEQIITYIYPSGLYASLITPVS